MKTTRIARVAVNCETAAITWSDVPHFSFRILPIVRGLYDYRLLAFPCSACSSCRAHFRESYSRPKGGPVAEWLACWTQALSGNSLRQTVHAHRASVHQAAKLVAALLRVAGVTADLSESNGSLPPGL